MQQIELFFIHFEDPKSPERVATMRDKNWVTQQANRAQKSPEKLSDMREKNRERTRSNRAAMSPGKTAKEQESRMVRQRNLTTQKEADIKEFIDPLVDNAGARGVDMTEICHPTTSRTRSSAR